MGSSRVTPVVLSGGSGTRLWPVSRHETPKQLEALVSDQTMLGETLSRVDGLGWTEPPVVVCNADHADAVRRVLRQRGHGGTVVLEPVARNTAAAVAAAAAIVDDDVVLLVMPADHVITNVAEFHRTAAIGAEAAADGSLVTFGIVPSYPATGYGYIRSEGTPDHRGVRRVAEFVEKPDEATAKQFVTSKDYLWNSGMFMFRASSVWKEMERHAADIATAVADSVVKAERSGDIITLDETAFSASRSISIDYAVMERTDRAVVVPLDAGWSDVGSWASLHDVLVTDDAGNVSTGDVVTHEVTNSYLRSDGTLLAAVGVDRVVAVATPDAVLISSIDRVDDVKVLVEQLRDDHRPEADRAQKRSTDVGSLEGLRRLDSTSVDLLTLDAGATTLPSDGTWVVASGRGRQGNRMLEAGDVLDTTAGAEDLHASEDSPLYIVRVMPLDSTE